MTDKQTPTKAEAVNAKIALAIQEFEAAIAELPVLALGENADLHTLVDDLGRHVRYAARRITEGRPSWNDSYGQEPAGDRVPVGDTPSRTLGEWKAPRELPSSQEVEAEIDAGLAEDPFAMPTLDECFGGDPWDEDNHGRHAASRRDA